MHQRPNPDGKGENGYEEHEAQPLLIVPPHSGRPQRAGELSAGARLSLQAYSGEIGRTHPSVLTLYNIQGDSTNDGGCC